MKRRTRKKKRRRRFPKTRRSKKKKIYKRKRRMSRKRKKKKRRRARKTNLRGGGMDFGLMASTVTGLKDKLMNLTPWGDRIPLPGSTNPSIYTPMIKHVNFGPKYPTKLIQADDKPWREGEPDYSKQFQKTKINNEKFNELIEEKTKSLFKNN